MDNKKRKNDFFGDVDRKPDGETTSEYPSWGFGTHIDELEESIASERRRMARGEIPEGDVPRVKMEVKKLEERLGEIKASKPTIEGPAKDKLALARSELKAAIGESLFTRSQMKLGLVDTHEEAHRMSKPIIEVNSSAMEEACKKCGVKIASNGCITRNEASKVYKILGKYLGEETNIEALRKD